jgi:hypothetical protein
MILHEPQIRLTEDLTFMTLVLTRRDRRLRWRSRDVRVSWRFDSMSASATFARRPA